VSGEILGLNEPTFLWHAERMIGLQANVGHPNRECENENAQLFGHLRQNGSMKLPMTDHARSFNRKAAVRFT